MSYPLYGLSSVLVGFLGYPLEVIDQCIFNFLVGFSFDPILIPNFLGFCCGFFLQWWFYEKTWYFAPLPLAI
jgi:hypothetical protein